MFSSIKTLAGYISTLISSIPAISKVRKYGRYAGTLGVVKNLAEGALMSISTSNPGYFLKKFALNLFALNEGIARNVETLQAATTRTEFLMVSWSIYSKLFVITLIVVLTSNYLKKAHLGDQVPDYQVYFVVFFLILTPYQLLGAIMVEVIEKGSFTGGLMWIPKHTWNGLYKLVANINLWTEPVIERISSTHIEESISQATNSTNSTTAKDLQVVKG